MQQICAKEQTEENQSEDKWMIQSNMSVHSQILNWKYWSVDWQLWSLPLLSVGSDYSF